MRPRLLDVANRAGVAITTASTILKNKAASWASEETCARVLKAAEDLGYRPNRIAQSLRTGQYFSLGLALPDLQNPFYTAFAATFDRIARDQGFHVNIEHSRGDAGDERRCFDTIIDQRVDGAAFFVCDPDFQRPFLTRLSERQYPAVALAHVQPRELPVDSVLADYSPGTADAVRHLLALGHRRFAYLRQILPAGHQDPRPGMFERCLREQGPADIHVDFLECQPTCEAAHAVVATYLGERGANRATALVAYNDLGAIGAMRAAIDRGLAVPRHLSIVGNNNIGLAGFLPIALSTVAIPVDVIACHAATLLLERIAGPREAPHRNVTVSTTFLDRETTAPIAPN